MLTGHSAEAAQYDNLVGNPLTARTLFDLPSADHTTIAYLPSARAASVMAAAAADSGRFGWLNLLTKIVARPPEQASMSALQRGRQNIVHERRV